MHAMTIHKLQGSQATEVTVLLPPDDSRLLTRELFYTAVTRAKEKIRVIGPLNPSVRTAVQRRVVRASGLASRTPPRPSRDFGALSRAQRDQSRRNRQTYASCRVRARTRG